MSTGFIKEPFSIQTGTATSCWIFIFTGTEFFNEPNFLKDSGLSAFVGTVLFFSVSDSSVSEYNVLSGLRFGSL